MALIQLTNGAAAAVKMEVDVEASNSLKRKGDQIMPKPCKKPREIDLKANCFRQLNERHPGLQYTITRDESVHPNMFTAVATINEMEISGTGSSKAKAKEDLARKYLKLAKLTPDLIRINTERAKSSPYMVMTEAFPVAKPVPVEGTARGSKAFKFEVEIQGRQFFGEGRSKKLARISLAKTVLTCFYGVQDYDPEPVKEEGEKKEVPLEKKFPSVQLKELVGDVEYEVTAIPNPEDISEEAGPWFACTATIKGTAYSGQGKTKTAAKLRCAKAALVVLKPKKEV